MLSLPLPILTFVLSVVVCGLIWRLDMGNRLARWFFIGVFVLLSVLSLLVGLRFGYGFENLIAVQRLLPLFIGPFIYLGYIALMVPDGATRRPVILHLGVAVAGAVLPQIVPFVRPYFDFVIGTSYLFYCVGLLILWRKGADSLVNAKLDFARVLRHWMLGAAAILAITFVMDSGIAISFALQRNDNAIQLISYGSIISMISVVLVIVALSRRPEPRRAVRMISDRSGGSNTILENTARELLQQSQLYLDTGLTLERLAKRLHVPARALSEAVNQTQNMNVSQYVNGFRLKHAAGLLANENLTVTQIMEQSGFLTRSNFYREFERVYAQSPTEYRRQRGEP